jgi:photosystem II stability/assembly factor-like uncharacterized protein
MRISLLVGVLLASLYPAAPARAAGPKFVMSYFYDQDKTEFSISDFKFPSAKHGMAVGLIQAAKSSSPAAITTIDGGEHWSIGQVKELSPKDVPISLHFTSADEGWMVTEKGLWYTSNFGRAWRKIGELPKGILKVWFLTTDHGWAIGENKQVIETTDGGKNWVPVAAAQEPPGTVVNTTYGAIVFLRNKGIIAGWNKARDNWNRPEWQSPTAHRYELPGTTIFLETSDGGKTWSSSSASMFGQLTTLSVSLSGTSLALFEFEGQFDSRTRDLPPSEVHRTSLETGKTDRVYKDPGIQITDLALTLEGKPYLTGHEMVGTVRANPIPGKLKVFTSADFANWTAIPVDYRATAHRSMVAIAEDQDVWVATDTGMILKLQND